MKSYPLPANPQKPNNSNHQIIATSDRIVPYCDRDDTLNNNWSNNWSASLQTVLDEPPARLPHRLITCGILSLVIMTIWAWFGQVEEIGTATGKLVPKGETYKVEPINSGKVSNINIREGEQVKTGQVLVELDTELLTQEVTGLEQILVAYELELTQKQALLEKAYLESQTNQRIMTAEIASQRSAIAIVREKGEILRQLLAQQQAEKQAYEHKQDNLQPLSSLTAEHLDKLRQEIIAHRERLQRLKSLEKKGAISQELVFQAEQELRQIEQQLIQSKMQETTTTKEQLFQAEQSLRELEARITQNLGELESAVKETEQLQAQLKQKKAESDRTLLADRQKINQLELEITQITSKIADCKNQLITAQAKLKQNSLTAPIDGTILSLNVNNIGKVVGTGETIVEIAPDDEPLILAAVLPNKEAGFVEIGMPVQVKLDAYAYQDYGFVAGRVTDISADAESNEQLGNVYQVEVALEQNHIMDNQKLIPFKPGQTAVADIIIRRRRIMEIFLDPIKKLQQDGMDL